MNNFNKNIDTLVCGGLTVKDGSIYVSSDIRLAVAEVYGDKLSSSIEWCPLEDNLFDLSNISHISTTVECYLSTTDYKFSVDDYHHLLIDSDNPNKLRDRVFIKSGKKNKKKKKHHGFNDKSIEKYLVW